ncbi:MAG: hypothetical protein N3B16_10730 [Candidatus Aminicenantes bacterium]|nr:hypothetical protein [Candidatus Aminicenantes bacterium]
MFIPGAVIFSIAMNWLVSLWSWPSEWPDFGPDGLGGLSTEDKAKLLAEEIVIPEEPLILGDGQTIVTAALLLNEPIERVWLLLSQPENQAEYLVEIKEAKCLKREESWDRVYFKIEILGLDLEFTVNHRYLPEIKAIYWTLDLETENDLKEFRGFWRLYSWPGNKTLARYGSQLKPKWKLAELLIRQLYKQRVKKSLLALKKYIETP